jgi:hypothetical protein
MQAIKLVEDVKTKPLSDTERAEYMQLVVNILQEVVSYCATGENRYANNTRDNLRNYN